MSGYNVWSKLIQNELLMSVSGEGFKISIGFNVPPVDMGHAQTAALADRLLQECNRLAALLESHGIDPESEPKR